MNCGLNETLLLRKNTKNPFYLFLLIMEKGLANT